MLRELLDKLRRVQKTPQFSYSMDGSKWHEVPDWRQDKQNGTIRFTIPKWARIVQVKFE